MDNVFDYTELLKVGRKNRNWNLYSLYFRALLNISLARFKWVNLPEELQGKEWYIEKKLALTGVLAMARDEETGKLMMLPCVVKGGVTMYGESPEYELIGENGFNRTFKRDDIAICYDNMSRQPITIAMAYEYAVRASDVQRTADVRLNKHKKPLMWRGNRKMTESIKNLEKDIKENSDSVIVDEDIIGGESIVMELKNDVGFIQRDLMSYKGDLFGEYFGFQGINFNPSNGKKERLVSEEQKSNNEQILNFRNSFLRSRKEFCKEANRKFGLNIDCFYESDTIDETAKKEGEEDDLE